MPKTRWASAAAVVIFLAALWTPIIGVFFGASEFRATDENRTAAPLPKPSRGPKGWLALGPAFTAYFHDHFGFRRALVTSQALLKVRVLGVSSSPEVIIGQQGWLFYAGEKSTENHRGLLPFSGSELASWVKLLNRRQQWLASRGIPMLLAIVPDKQSVYPEFLPSSMRKVRPRTRLDELMQSASNVRILDLRGAMLNAKSRNSEVYYRTDTHWNGSGVYAGFMEILGALAAKKADVQPSSFGESSAGGERKPGDLATMLGLGSVWRELPISVPALTARTTELPGGDLLVEQEAGGKRRMVMFGDSFSYPLIPYLSEHFGRMVASRSTALKPELVSRESPDVVLFEMVERKLNGPPPDE